MFKNKIKKNKKENLVSGFTLVETMVAVFILSLTIISLMTVVANSLFASRYSRDEITVNYLLQEAVDYVRNDRDSSIFLSNSSVDEAWKKFSEKYKNCTEDDQGCYLDVFNSLKDPSSSYLYLTKCENNNDPGNTSCPAFSYNPDREEPSFYNYENDGTTTSFKRKIVFKEGISPDELIVKATVYWINGDTTKSRSLQTSLLKW